MSRLPRFFACAALALVLLLPRPSQASDFVGAEPFDQDERAWFAVGGLPDLTIGMHYGLSSLADVTPTLRLMWAEATRLGGFGVGLGGQLRLRVATLEGWHLAVVARPEVFLHADVRDHPPEGPGRTALFGVDCGVPGLVLSHRLGGEAVVSLGLRAPIVAYLGPRASMAVPLTVDLSGEAALGEHASLLASVGLGTIFYGPGGRTDEEITGSMRVGLGWH